MVGHTNIPLIPRKTFFENANALNPLTLARWALARLDRRRRRRHERLGSAARRSDQCPPITRQTDRPIFAHWFARTNAHVLFRKDKDGDENFNLWCVGIDGSDVRNLTPYRDVLAIVVGFHRENPHLIAVGMNDRDARWHDLYVVDIRTGERRLVHENKDEIASLVLDSRAEPQARHDDTQNKGSGSAILRWNGTAFEEIISIEADDVLSTDPLHVTRAGDAWFLRSSVGRDTAVDPARRLENGACKHRSRATRRPTCRVDD